MKKHKKLFITLGIVLSITIGLMFVMSSKKDDFYKENTETKIVKRGNTISMMLETEAGSGNYEMTTQSEWPTDGYTFNSTLSKCENGGELSWDDTNKKVYMSGNLSDKCYVYFDKKPTLLADYIKSLYAGTQGNNNIYYHDGSIKDSNGNVIDAEDNSYRYSGTNNDVNNFVCFDGSDCNDEKNLYRIVGVYENTKVKLLKYEYVTTDEVGKDNNVGTFSKSDYPNYDGTLETIPKFSWAASASSTVAMLSNYRVIFTAPTPECDNTKLGDSSLIIDNLNKNYLNSLDDNIKSKIIQNKFKYYVTEVALISFNRAKQAYIYEYGSYSYDRYYDEKIGILNSNEYLFSFSKDFWLTKSNNIEGPNSWIFRGIPEYLNSQTSNVILMIGYINNDGSIRVEYSCDEEDPGELTSRAIRPTFYVQDIKLLSGNGTKQNPYIIE